jgi:hypothetical protein
LLRGEPALLHGERRDVTGRIDVLQPDDAAPLVDGDEEVVVLRQARDRDASQPGK